MTRFKTVFAGIAAVAMLLAASACGGGDDPEDTSKNTAIRVGMLKSQSPVFVAMDKGYFKDEGLDVSVDFVQSGSDLLPLLASGELQAGLSSPAAGFFNAFVRGVDVKIVADAGQFREGYPFASLVVRKELVESGKVKSVADLKGKRIAITSEGSAMQMLATQAVQAGGLNASDVKMPTMSFPAMIPALTKGQIDAALLTEPFVTQVTTSGVASVLIGGDKIDPDGQHVVLMYSPKLVKDSDTGTRFMAAWLRGVRDYQAAFGPDKEDQAAVVDILHKHVGLDTELIRTSVPTGLDPDGKLNRSSLKERQDFWVKIGLVKEPQVIDDLIDDSFRKNAASELG